MRSTAFARRACAALLLASPMWLTPRSARAHGEGGELVVASRPPAPPGEGADAEHLLKELAVEVAADAKLVTVTVEATTSAEKALERAQGARASGDMAHAHMLEGLALEWAEAARELARAAKAEAKTRASATSAQELATQVERARALLEETQARSGRARAELEHAEANATNAVSRAAEAERRRIEDAKKGGRGPKGKKTKAAAPKSSHSDREMQ